MPIFRKDFSVFKATEKTTQVPPDDSVMPHPVRRATTWRSPTIVAPPVMTHHSTLLLLEMNNLAQSPGGHWDKKIVNETPRRNQNSHTIFEPESPARQRENQHRREIKQRKLEKEARSLEPGWIFGPGQLILPILEELENLRCELQDAGRWENAYLDLRMQRDDFGRANQWFGKHSEESEDEKRMRLEAESSLRGISALEWTREFETHPHTQVSEVVNSSSDSIKASRRTSMFFMGHRRESSNSIISSSTRSSTATNRSSFMSMTQASTLSSPTSSAMPSPTLSADSEKNLWGIKEAPLASPDIAQEEMTLPPLMVPA